MLRLFEYRCPWLAGRTYRKQIVYGVLLTDRKRLFLAVWMKSMCPRLSQVDTTGRRKCVLAVGNVHFVDIDIVDRCAGDGCVEAGEELLKSLIPLRRWIRQVRGVHESSVR
jgi:hypothetical protein